MACRIVAVGDKGFAIACSRGRRDCQTPGCRGVSTKLCDYPVRGKKSGTCDRRMCASCSRPQPAPAGSNDTIDFCRAHDELAKASTTGGTP